MAKGESRINEATLNHTGFLSLPPRKIPDNQQKDYTYIIVGNRNDGKGRKYWTFRGFQDGPGGEAPQGTIA
jgi:hypothetical protein